MTSEHIGLLRERPLHASIKEWYREPGDLVEESVDGFVVDLVRPPLLIEVQTGSFAKMKRKLQTLLPRHPVRIVHPIALDRWIVRVGEGGELLSRRRSPKHGSMLDVFAELVAFPGLTTSPNLTVEVLLTREDEFRRHDPEKAWRRRGWVIEERHLLEVVDRRIFEDPDDFAALLPDVPDAFTTAQLSAAAGCPRRLAQQAAYCLRKMGAIRQVDKVGNAAVYQRV